MPAPSRGAWVFYNVTRSASFHPTLDSILITQELPDMTATLSCRVVDPDSDLVFAVEDQVRVTFAGERIWAGHLKTVTEDRLEETGPRAWDLEGQDYTAKLDDALITRRKKRKKEKALRRVRWLLRQLDRRVWTLAGKDLSHIPDEYVEAYDYFGDTVDEGLAHVADELRMHYFVDLDNTFQMYRTDAVAAPFDLDNDDPDYTDTFPFRDWRNTEDSVDLANAILVEPEKRKHSRWAKDATSIAAYGRQERFLSDSNIHRKPQALATGNRTLADTKDPDTEATLTIFEPGIWAGMKVHVVEALWSHDYDRYVRAVQIRAVDPHDDDGKAYLFTEATVGPMWRKKRKPSRHGVNKNARRRPGQTADADPHVIDRFARTVAPPSWEAGSALGVSLNTRGARRGVDVNGVERPFVLAATYASRVGSYVGDWYKTISAPDYACGYPQADFRGWWDKEAWVYLTVPAHPTGMAGITVTVTPFGADGSGYGGGGRATIDGLDIVVLSSAPTDTWQGTPIGSVPVDGSPHDVFVPGAYVPAAGGTLWVGARAAWRCDYGASAPYCDYPLWPYDTGLGNSGKCQAGFSAATWATWVAEGDSMGTIEVVAGDAPWDGGNAWRDAGTEGSPTYGVDGQTYYVTSTGLGGHGLYVVGEREDEDEPRGPWSDVSWAIQFTFEVDDEGDEGTAGPRHIQVTTTGEGEQTIGTVHLGDSTNAAGISVGGPTTNDYAAKAIVAATKYRAKFDSRSNRMRGKLWAVGSDEPTDWDVDVAMAETEDDSDRFLLWVRCGNTTEQTVRIHDIHGFDDGGEGKRLVREWLGRADGTTNLFTTCHPFREGTLVARINGVDTPPSWEDGDNCRFRTDFYPTAGMAVRATYIIDQGG